MLRQIVQILFVLLLSLVVTQAGAAHAQASSNPWAIKLQILNDQNVTTSVFNPFDQIQVRATVTYNNASQPDVLVTFNVVGPSANSTNPVGTTKITRIEMTQANGEAGFSFRVPIQAQNEETLIGTWNVTATISGAPPQSTSFTTQWALTTTAINLLNSQGKSQSAFSPASNIEVQLEVNNTGPALPVNVTINMQDPTGQIINQTEILNSQIASSNQTQTQQTIIQVPSNAPAGQASINAAIYKGTYNGTEIPAAENQTVYFTVSSVSTTSSPTSTPTPTPKLTPSSSPSPSQNNLTLFSWLLVATGLFTFTLLYVGLRRKQKAAGTQAPKLPETTPAPIIAPTPTNSKPEPPTTQQPPPTAPLTPENRVQAATIGQTSPIYETWLSQTGSSSDASNRPDLKQATPEEAAQSITSHLRRIYEGGRKVQGLETSLKAEREQLNKEITALNRIIEDQERAIMSYFESIRQAVAAASTAQPTEENESHETQPIQADNKQNPPPPQTSDKRDTQPTSSFTSPNVTVNAQPEQVKDDRYNQPQPTEQNSTMQHVTIITQPEVKIGQGAQLTEVENKSEADKAGTQVSEKTSAGKKVKETPRNSTIDRQYLKSTIEKIENLEVEKKSLLVEVEELRKIADAKATALESEVNALREEFKSLKELKIEKDTKRTEVNGTPKPPTMETNRNNAQASEITEAGKNVKEPPHKIRREERTQEEDIKIAEHTRED